MIFEVSKSCTINCCQENFVTEIFVIIVKFTKITKYLTTEIRYCERIIFRPINNCELQKYACVIKCNYCVLITIFCRVGTFYWGNVHCRLYEIKPFFSKLAGWVSTVDANAGTNFFQMGLRSYH